jgi:hypothetical protein
MPQASYSNTAISSSCCIQLPENLPLHIFNRHVNCSEEELQLLENYYNFPKNYVIYMINDEVILMKVLKGQA